MARHSGHAHTQPHTFAPSHQHFPPPSAHRGPAGSRGNAGGEVERDGGEVQEALDDQGDAGRGILSPAGSESMEESVASSPVATRGARGPGSGVSASVGSLPTQCLGPGLGQGSGQGSGPGSLHRQLSSGRSAAVGGSWDLSGGARRSPSWRTHGQDQQVLDAEYSQENFTGELGRWSE